MFLTFRKFRLSRGSMPLDPLLYYASKNNYPNPLQGKKHTKWNVSLGKKMSITIENEQSLIIAQHYPWVVMCHQYEISVLIPQTSFVVVSQNVGCFLSLKRSTKTKTMPMIITWTHNKVCPKSSNKPSSIKFCLMHFMHKLSCKARFPLTMTFNKI